MRAPWSVILGKPDDEWDLQSPIDRGEWIKEGNRDAITATMIKGTATLLATSLNLTSIHLSDAEAKLVTSAVAASVSTVLLFLLGAITDWAKGQGSRDKSDAALIKMFAKRSKTTLKQSTTKATNGPTILLARL